MTSSDHPRRGEVWLVSFGASRSGEPGKTRPAVVVSPAQLVADSERALVVVVPLSSSVSESPLRPTIAKAAGLESASRAVTPAIRGTARGRLQERIGRVSARELASIEVAVQFTLGLHDA